MNRLLVFIGLCCVAYYIVGDALQGGFTFFGHALPILALALVVIFYRSLRARLATMTKKLEDIADEMDANAKAGDEERARGKSRVDGVGAMDGSAEIRLSPTKEGAPPDGVFMDDKGNVSIRLAALPGEEDRKQFAGDPKKTHLVHELLKVPHEERDKQWYRTFLDNVADANFYCDESSQPVDGPDGFPYLSLASPEPGKIYQAWVIRHILPNLLDHGFGVVINSHKGRPDWVFSYGDIVNYHIYGAFDAVDERFEARDDAAPAHEMMEKGETVSVGEVSQGLLPSPVRDVLTRFLEAHQVSPKVLLMNRAPRPETRRKGGLSLVFPLPAGASEDDALLGYVTRALPWFLPRHFSVLWVREEDNWHFFDLRQAAQKRSSTEGCVEKPQGD